MHVDGLNVDDPGMKLLAGEVSRVPASEVLLVCSGEVPAVGAEATRLILDVRERRGDGPKRVALQPGVPGPDLPALRMCAMWPRAHLGKDFSQQCIGRSALLLPPGGRLLCAVRKQKGADSLARFMGEMFGDVRIIGRERGYRLLQSERGTEIEEVRAWELVRRRYRIEDPALGDVVLQSAPGVFSRRELDAGTRCLLEHVARGELDPASVLDLCCGVGPLGIWAAKRWARARVLAVDSNVVAVSLARDNAQANGVHLVVYEHAGLPAEPASWARPQCPPQLWNGDALDLVLVNPPTHADGDALAELFAPLPAWTAAGARCFAVAARPGPVASALEATGAAVSHHPYTRYTVIEARF